jgi:putative nucleotidyltransferase with HDIG domain
MAEWMSRRATRREQVREHRAKVAGTWRARVWSRLASWPTLAGVIFVVGAGVITAVGEGRLEYSVGQRVEHPVYARVDFQVPEKEATEEARAAARKATPSFYSLNAPALPSDLIRNRLMTVYQAADESESYEQFRQLMEEKKRPADQAIYEALRGLGGEAGAAQYREWVQALPLEQEYVVRGLPREPRDPPSSVDFIRLEGRDDHGRPTLLDIPHRQLIQQGNERALRWSAAAIAELFPLAALRPVVENVALDAFKEQPTMVFNSSRTVEEMRKAEEATPDVVRTYEKGKAFVNPGIAGPEELLLLKAHHAAYAAFLRTDLPEARMERRRAWLRTGGMLGLVAIIAIGLMVYTRLYEESVHETASRSLAFLAVSLGTLLAGRLLDLRWPELICAPVIFTACVFSIVYSRRFATGAVSVLSVLVCTQTGRDIAFLIVLLTGSAVVVVQLNEIRKRTKLIVSGTVTAVAVMAASAAASLWQGHSAYYVVQHMLWAGVGTLLAFSAISAVLPLIEKVFRVATALTLLEWRDPARPLLQLLATKAPGTYTHSLTVGTLAEAACEQIGANGLLAYVGALYHDVGKAVKPDYFTENQVGPVSRHERLAPTMSLLIIVGHVKDGIEMAREYKLPKVLHQFIEEHHGTTVVRYFHHVASEKQPLIASGRHDREVSEAEFRYPGPKPQARESAVLMLCDAVEGAARALQDPTAMRIETVVHDVVSARLEDGQFDDCDISLKEIRRVEESLVKTLCSIHHGRIAYPKPRKPEAEETEPERISV